MPVFKDFSENGELLNSRRESIIPENFERYVKEHGPEKAEGYLDAIEDIVCELQKLFYEQTATDFPLLNAKLIKKNADAFYWDKFELLEFAKQKMESKPSNNATMKL